jgi:hypothetical protein
MNVLKKLKLRDFDFDRDGIISEDEKDRATHILELELREEKAEAQKRMSWIAMSSMLVVTAILFTPLVSVEKLAGLEELLGMFYIAQASIIGFYFGSTAYMSRSSPNQY